jgi:hypothetical protein
MIAFDQLNSESIAHHRTSMGLLCSAAFRFPGRSSPNMDLKPGQVRRNAGIHLDMPALPTMRRLFVDLTSTSQGLRSGMSVFGLNLVIVSCGGRITVHLF